MSEQFHTSLDGGRIVVGFEKGANREDLDPQLSTSLQITLDRDSFPELR